MRDNRFGDWLQEQLDQRGWKQAELARRASLDTGLVSRLLRGLRDPSAEVARALARALELPEGIVFRSAGLLTESSSDVRTEGRQATMSTLFDQLTSEDQEELLHIARLKLSLRSRKESNRETPSSAKT